ncbi:MAG: hypothetical protein HY903_11730 [Deltaproteobacteria bacterium]|nr:hypothetical protein [Deltaproteobacteria bacterium]
MSNSGAGNSKNGPAGLVSFATLYDDFRVVDGVLFAFKEVNLVRGAKIAETVLTKVEVAKPLPVDAFAP